MSELVGIAKLAAEGPQLEQKRRVEYRELPTRRYLSRCANPAMPFRWMINPYRGCEFGCKYCYARYTHEFMELRDPEDFERRIFAKEFRSADFRREIQRLEVGATVAMGTGTDPYQPAERRFGITRQMLEVLAKTSGLDFGITTKSDLIARDVDLLAEIARRHVLTVAMTITTVDAELARKLEPLTPRPELRLKAVEKLSLAGIATVVFCAPVLPLINDRLEQLDALAAAAARHGAQGFAGNVLFLKPSAQRVFLPFLDQQFPALSRRYRERYLQGNGKTPGYLRGSYPEVIGRRIDDARRRHRLIPRSARKRPLPELWPRRRQLELFASA